MNERIIKLDNVDKIFGKRKVIENVSFEIFEGDICGFIGPNGAGKTTIIKMITGLITPTKGKIFIKSINVIKDREKALTKVGALVESPIFFNYMTGRKNLQNLARLNFEMNRKKQLEKVEEVLEIVGLKTKDEDRGADKVKTYSLGMKQRLGIAQALLNNPKIVILDEPANGLDPIGMKDLRELILKLKGKYGITFFISSHLLDELQKICNRYLIIKEGKLIWSGSSDILLKTSGKTLEETFIDLMA
ncbi:ATP-binding cassette domain-containing protein [Clostridium estertheticum]|uniref:ABC transporter ATP-binding protein n=1 Tax=Clostridium estertheticum TaxID=238834 RepID=UPI001CF2B3B0|nr:ATP-binding cassette domain-containing protein [Clostridium estertheticum]MCB2308337.1 ATP-binding cassette domain-containing protein [Clostridium estertheticum]MCB2346468.1 ATP-binding cassette domain-containing protein [Clostridium estertheticum]MCB2349436.1 ATP-binding cassette domain-containing protein [Clostridium estertheticum]WAG46414.1 ATP-binding cassette domain-containing protein [Clostridium estertheticum]